MSVGNNQIRLKKVVDALRRIESGFYVRFEEQINKMIVHKGTKRAEALMIYLDACPVGDGVLYENLTLATMKESLGKIIDWVSLEQHFPSQGGYGDIELPFSFEMLEDYPFWKPWFYRYEIESILIEIKNTKTKATPGNAGQLKRYLDTSNKGHFGMLVSRSGFSINAKKTLRSYADNKQCLILPLDHSDLKELLKLSLNNAAEVMTFLRQKQIVLRRA